MKCPFLLAVAGALLAVPAVAQVTPVPTISVTGEASLSTPPDLATIDGGVTNDGKTAQDASETNNATMGKVLLALKSAGIDDKDVQTSRLSLQPQYQQQGKTGPDIVSGYRASNHVTIRLRDITKVAATIDMLVAAGANDIGGIGFIVANASKLLDDARTQAIADARRKAEIYASAAGVTLGAPVSIAEQGGPVQMPFRKMFTAAAPTPIAQGEETLKITVSVAWAIKPPTP